MATFGQGINPQLGAIDYSPILRGSMAGAQMAAQGSQMIGQGLANLGQEVGKGMQIYYKKKEEKKLLDDGINTLQNLYTKSPELFENIIKDPNDKGAWRALIKTAGGPAQVMQMATAINAGIDERGGQELAALYGSQGTTEISPEDGTRYSAKARLLGTNQFMQQQINAANLEKTLSEAALNKATAGSKVSLAGYGTLKEAQDSIPTEQRKNYTFHFTNNRYVVLPIDAKTSLEVKALEESNDRKAAGKTADLALKAAGGTPETHRVDWTGDGFVATPFNKTELLEIKAKQGVLDEKDKKTLDERRKYNNKIENELYAANLMKEQLTALKTQAANTQPGFWTTLASNIPGTASADLAAQIDTIMSKIGFDRLREMREISPNGSSGLGALNVKEFDALQNSLANLKKSQSGAQFQSNLEIVQKNYDRVIASLEQDKRDFSSSGGSAGSSSSATALSPAAQQYLPR